MQVDQTELIISFVPQSCIISLVHRRCGRSQRRPAFRAQHMHAGSEVAKLGLRRHRKAKAVS